MTDSSFPTKCKTIKIGSVRIPLPVADGNQEAKDEVRTPFASLATQIKGKAKRVENFFATCLDGGSIPPGSTQKKRGCRFRHPLLSFQGFILGTAIFFASRLGRVPRYRMNTSVGLRSEACTLSKFLAVSLNQSGS